MCRPPGERDLEFDNCLIIIYESISSERDTDRLAGTQAVLDVTLEDDAVGLCEPEGLVDTL